MKKRLFSLLTVLCLVFGLMPGTALADWEAPTYTYDQLVAKIARVAGQSYPDPIEFVPAADFGWPEGAVLSIPARVALAPTEAWEIPEGVTVYFEPDARGISGKEITVNGTIKTAYSSEDNIFGDCEKIIIGPGADFICEPGESGYVPTAEIYIAEESTLEVLAGADLNAAVTLHGTLTGAGTVSGRVEINSGYRIVDGVPVIGDPVISGTLTFSGGYIQVGRRSNESPNILTIPAGSHIRLAAGGSLQIENEKATVYLGGKLELLDSTDPEWDNGCFISFREAGKLIMEAGSEIILRDPASMGQNAVGWEEEESFSAETQDQFPRFVEGTGTIKFYGEAAWYGFFHSSPDTVVWYLERADWIIPAERYIDFTNITIWRSWMCTHVFEEGEVLTEPTCTEPGELSGTCIYCGTTSVEPIAPKGHTETAVPAVEPTIDTCGYTAGTACADCGITMSGRELVPALFASLSPSVDNDKLTVVGAPEETVSVAVAFYDAEGGLLSIGLRTVPAGAMNESFDLPAGAASYSVFAMDESWMPGCEVFRAVF